MRPITRPPVPQSAKGSCVRTVVVGKIEVGEVPMLGNKHVKNKGTRYALGASATGVFGHASVIYTFVGTGGGTASQAVI